MDVCVKPMGGVLRAALGVLLLVSVVTAYAPALRAGFVWDDKEYVTHNPLLHSTQGLVRIWVEPAASPQYYPLTMSTFWVEHQLWGVRPFGYHLVNVVLHAGNALLLALVLGALGVPGACLAAGIFALHPVHVESVAWVTERKNVLSTFFFLSALAAYLRHTGLWSRGATPGLSDDGGSRTRGFWYWSSLTFFLLALLSKTAVVSFPPVLLLLIWWQRGRVSAREVLDTAPFFACGLALGLFTVWFERTHVLARGAEWALSFVERSLVAGRIVWFYLSKLLWPGELAFIYPRWTIDAASVGAYLYPLGVLAVLVVLWRFRGRVGRGPGAAALFFVVTLFPVLGFFDVYFMRYSYVADHFQYLASLGPITVVAAGVARFGVCGWPVLRGGGTGPRSLPSWVGLAVPGALLAVLGGLTWERGHAFRDNEKLWRDTIRKNPAAWVAHNNLGVILDERGQRPEAEFHYREALRLRPTFWEAINNFGLLLAETGRTRQAEEHYKIAAAGSPSYAAPRYNLGRLSEAEGRPHDAERYYRDAIRADPNLAEAYFDLGLLLAGSERFGEAIACYRDALTLAPEHVEAHYNLAVALARTGQGSASAVEYQKVLNLAPDHVEALNNLAAHFGTSGDLEKAANLFGQAVASRPEDAGLRVNLGRALAAGGRPDAAVAQFREALRLDPGDESARQGLAQALSMVR